MKDKQFVVQRSTNDRLTLDVLEDFFEVLNDHRARHKEDLEKLFSKYRRALENKKPKRKETKWRNKIIALVEADSGLYIEDEFVVQRSTGNKFSFEVLKDYKVRQKEDLERLFFNASNYTNATNCLIRGKKNDN